MIILGISTMKKYKDLGLRPKRELISMKVSAENNSVSSLRSKQCPEAPRKKTLSREQTVKVLENTAVDIKFASELARLAVSPQTATVTQEPQPTLRTLRFSAPVQARMILQADSSPESSPSSDSDAPKPN